MFVMGMSGLITWEWQFFSIAIMWGIILSIFYDGLRILRRVFIHKKITMLAIEDIIFWMISGFIMFHVIFMVNDGIIRVFALMGFALGAAMYQYTISYYLVKYISKVAKYFKRMSIKIVLKIFINPLKKLCKSITMKMNKRKIRRKEKRDLLKTGKKSNGKVRDKKKQRVKNKKTKTI